LPLHDNSIVVTDGYSVGGEDDTAPGVTKLAHGQEGLSGKGWDHMTMACSRWEPW